MSFSSVATSSPHELDLTIISGKHLKNVNWKNGDLKPYAIFWVDPDNNKLTTKSDDSGHTKPVWNQRFILPINSPLSVSSFNLEIFHSKSSETPKPFVGSLHVSLSDLPDPTNGSLIRTFNLHRPSGRPQGKIRLKLSLKQHTIQPVPPNYQNAPVDSYYYSSAPPYPFGSASRSSPAPATATAYPYFSGGWPTQARSYCAPSAPVEYGQSQTRVGSGSGSGFVVGALGGMALDEGLRREEGRMGERVGENSGVRDDFSDYRAEC